MNMKTAAIRLACLATAGVLLAVPLAAGTASYASATPASTLQSPDPSRRPPES
ncbi:hypothetical protein CQR47_1781 [Bifidobacterium thermophilum]|uniref:Uncharacterized protein n=1 Tax=Bifidobacterium thermophilum TaxID=33905 RepID=A0A2N3QE97_9BIFI|nr:hypothetical protein [Bifidobacterium thermophilum]PKU88432.1 hypothetical protein CQR47_1781 [Bifidobacterium thermophilum]